MLEKKWYQVVLRDDNSDGGDVRYNKLSECATKLNIPYTFIQGQGLRIHFVLVSEAKLEQIKDELGILEFNYCEASLSQIDLIRRQNPAFFVASYLK